jgi:hypothetical protein
MVGDFLLIAEKTAPYPTRRKIGTLEEVVDNLASIRLDKTLKP